MQVGARHWPPKLQRMMAEGEGVEPSTVRSARFSGPVACHHAPPSELVVPARLERATPAFGRRCSHPLSYGTKINRIGKRPVFAPRATTGTHRFVGLARRSLGEGGWYAQEESNDSNQRPPASEAGTLAGLSYTLLALRREIESLSPDRQSGRLTRCVTEPRRIGASGPTRTATECALNALPLPIGVQTHDHSSWPDLFRPSTP